MTQDFLGLEKLKITRDSLKIARMRKKWDGF